MPHRSMANGWIGGMIKYTNFPTKYINSHSQIHWNIHQISTRSASRETITGVLVFQSCMIMRNVAHSILFQSVLSYFFHCDVCKYIDIQEAQRATYCAPEYNVPPFLWIGQDGHFNFPIGLKNTNFVEHVEILLPVEFHWIPFSGFRGEVENVSANQRPGWPSCFSDWLEKHNLCRGRWDLASCQVSSNSVQQFQRRSRKCLSQSEARAAILFFPSARKTQTL